MQGFLVLFFKNKWLSIAIMCSMTELKNKQIIFPLGCDWLDYLTKSWSTAIVLEFFPALKLMYDFCNI